MLEFSISDGENFEFPPKLFGGKIEILSSSESLGVLRHIIGRKNSSERWDREVWEFAGFENQVRECIFHLVKIIIFFSRFFLTTRSFCLGVIGVTFCFTF